MCVCHQQQGQPFDRNFYLSLIAALLGIATGYWQYAPLTGFAVLCSDLFITLLKLVSLPIIFLSIVATASSMGSLQEVKFLGLKVVKYTLLTTVLAASVALLMFVLYNPVASHLQATVAAVPIDEQGSYWSYLLKIVPSNFLQPFIENNVISVMFLALILSSAIITLGDQHRQTLHTGFAALYAAIMKLTTSIIKLMPIAVWAFVALFVRDLHEGLELESLAYYLGAVISANIIQGFVVLPLILKAKGISPVKLFKDMSPALSVAFFSKSSSATLPMALNCAQERAKLSPKVAGFSLPLCTTINMNGCAAFILITVLFVSMSHGMQFSPLEMVSWIFVATIAAVGNAGVPMGCFFLASAFLAAMNIPLHIMGIILPFYTLIDMIETSINVWSDSCVTAIVQRDVDCEAEGVVPQVIQANAVSQ